jgi:hypothetical protein
MRSDLVAGVGYSLHEMGHPFSDPPENEAGRLYVPSLHQLEHSIHRPLDAKFAFRPRMRCDNASEIRDVEPILDVD